jgi:hypothetical protein
VLCPTVSPIPPPAPLWCHNTIPAGSLPERPPRSSCLGGVGAGKDQGWNGCSRLPYEAGEGIARGVGQWGTRLLRLRARHHDIEVLILNVQDSFTEFVILAQ